MAIRTDSDLMRDLPAGVYGRLLSAASSVSPIAVDVLSSHRSEFARRSRSVNAVEGRVAREGVLIGA